MSRIWLRYSHRWISQIRSDYQKARRTKSVDVQISISWKSKQSLPPPISSSMRFRSYEFTVEDRPMNFRGIVITSMFSSICLQTPAKNIISSHQLGRLVSTEPPQWTHPYTTIDTDSRSGQNNSFTLPFPQKISQELDWIFPRQERRGWMRCSTQTWNSNWHAGDSLRSQGSSWKSWTEIEWVRRSGLDR